MQPSVFTLLLFIVMVLIVVSFIVSAWVAHHRHRCLLVAQAQTVLQNTDSTHPLDKHVTAILHLQDGVIVGIEKPQTLSPSTLGFGHFLPPSWYTRRRTLVSLGLLLMVMLTLFIQSGLADGALHGLSNSLGFLSFAQSAPPQPINVDTVAHPLPPLPDTASVRLVRIDSGLSSQYYPYQVPAWEYSSCSGIAMEMVMDAYGRHYIAGDILQEELNLGVWSVSMGLLRDDGIALTADHFGFNTDASHSLTVDALISIANKGTPVIVSLRDNYYFPNGHLFVILSGDSQSLSIADSSPANFKRMTRTMFAGMWQGFSAVLTPR